MRFQHILQQHQHLQLRRVQSQAKLDEARAEFKKEEILQQSPEICVFAAGSLGRLESGSRSDLDVFVTATKEWPGKLKEIQVFSAILNVNTNLAYPELSKDGAFLRIFGVEENEEMIGSPSDDSINWFTARMLLLLESNCLCNDETYHEHKQKILGFYFRDQQAGFKPVFLLNDILRYWRTLCLNYELARFEPGTSSWKKRNFNLRYSRLLTVFGTVLPLMLVRDVSVDEVEKLTSYTPMERFAQGLDMLVGSEELEHDFPEFLNYYEDFLATKETRNFNELDSDERNKLKDRAEFIARFVYRALNHPSVPEQMRRYLVV